MPTASKRVSVPRDEGRSHLEKAQQFLSSGFASAERAQYDAALLGAIHAGISAADAVSITLAGVRSTDPDHSRAVDLLSEIAGGSKEVAGHARQLRQLLGKKNTVEYESRRATAAESADALKRADRLVEWASEILASAGR